MDATVFAGRLRELRELASLSREQLAERAGIKPSRIRDLEQGLHVPRWDAILALAKALDVECTAFTVPATDVPSPRVGRPKKQATHSEQAPELSGRKKGKRQDKP
jgi:transcriptional regulator with XRE-family HTH domain